MSDLFSKFDNLINERADLLAKGVRDPFAIVMQEVKSPTVAIIDGKETILLGTYNYMGMTFDPDVIAAGKEALTKFGAGTTGSRVLNGTYQGHKECEDALKEFYGTEHAMVFSTGYQANLGMVATLAGKGDFIILDADSHASIYDGCYLGNADIVRFKHNSVEDLEKRLRRLPPEAGAMVLVDEAHGMGFFGENGRGVYEAAGVADDVDFVVGTFSKSVGTVGGFCVSNHPKFEILRLVCRPYTFTASLPPAVVACAATSIRKLMHAGDKRARLWDMTRKLHGGLKARGFRLATETPESAIVSVLMPDQETTVRMWQAMLELGVYVNMSRPPATPAGVFLLRCSLCAEHSAAQLDTVLERFAMASAVVGLFAEAAE